MTKDKKKEQRAQEDFVIRNGCDSDIQKKVKKVQKKFKNVYLSKL